MHDGIFDERLEQQWRHQTRDGVRVRFPRDLQTRSQAHLLNGQEVNSGRLGNTTEGCIVLQSEGAEIYYRNMQIKEL